MTNTKANSTVSLTNDCLCVWEALLDNPAHMDLYPYDMGFGDRREHVINDMTPFINKAYDMAEKLGYSDSYDWEFCPAILGRLDTWDVKTISDETLDRIVNSIADEYIASVG